MIPKRDFAEIHHQQNAHLNEADKEFEFILLEISNYYQIGTSYLKNGENLWMTMQILLHRTFAHLFKEGYLSITGGS